MTKPHIGKRATEPKHNKRPENRMYSVIRRGTGKPQSRDEGGINPDLDIDVAAVCDDEVRIYSKKSRIFKHMDLFWSHGAAREFAAEFNASNRKRRAEAGDQMVPMPFYQVKVAGSVVEHTPHRETAHALLRRPAAYPAELWRITDGGAQLLDRVNGMRV